MVFLGVDLLLLLVSALALLCYIDAKGGLARAEKKALLERRGHDQEPASTGCVLTDQIFEAARKKGIRPYDVIGPAPDYDEWDE